MAVEVHQEFFESFPFTPHLASLFVLLELVIPNQSVPLVSNEFQDLSVLAWQHLELMAACFVLMPFQLKRTVDAQMEPDRYADATVVQFETVHCLNC